MTPMVAAPARHPARPTSPAFPRAHARTRARPRSPAHALAHARARICSHSPTIAIVSSANAAAHPCHPAAHWRVAPLIARAAELPGQISELESVQAALARADGIKTCEMDAVRAARETVAGVKTAVTDRAGAARDGAA